MEERRVGPVLIPPEMMPELELDLMVSQAMVKSIVEETPLRKWHSERIIYLHNLISMEQVIFQRDPDVQQYYETMGDEKIK